MSIEIERKFLVANDGWTSAVVRTIHIRDGLVVMEDGRKARVRIAGDVATLALKGQRFGLSRAEFEYQIPMSDAQEILRSMCGDRVLVKSRHFVPFADLTFGDLTWEIDSYEGILSGIVIAEVELQREDQPVPLPDWIGREITGDPKYRKVNMLAERHASRQATEPVLA
jgi:CYTH domain-containing protein